MNISQIITNAITVLLAVIGWRIGHYYNTKRDKELKRREITTEHLINAYRVLANDVTRREASPERNLKIETIIADLQLFGSIGQIELAKQLANDITNKDIFYIDELMQLLRDNLRKDLGLTPVNSNITWLRFGGSKSQENDN